MKCMMASMSRMPPIFQRLGTKTMRRRTPPARPDQSGMEEVLLLGVGCQKPIAQQRLVENQRELNAIKNECDALREL
jgi:hypothetical protein